jgi:4-nitrophenyl phosphatase
MRLNDFDAVLFDLDGTLYHEGVALPGADDALRRLQRAGLRTACITNASARTSEQLSQTLADMGIDVPSEAIYSSGQAAVDWMLETWEHPRVYNFGGAAIATMLEGKATLVTSDDQPCDVVFVGTHTRVEGVPFNMDRALVGLAHLRRGAHLALGCADRVFPIAGGGVEFGSGALGALFIYAANLPEERIFRAGKPGAAFFEHLCARLKVTPRRCLLVGDNLESDIAGGKRLGMTCALVLTGVTSRAEAQAADVDLVVEDLTALINLFDEQDAAR